MWNVDEKLLLMFLWNIKEYKSVVICFLVFEIGESVLSGFVDKIIRV